MQKFVFVNNIPEARQYFQKCNKRLIVRDAFVLLLGLEIHYASSYALFAKLGPSIICILRISGSRYQIKYSMTLSLIRFLKTIDREGPPDGN